MPNLPTLTPEQRAEALRKAVQLRSERAGLLRQIKKNELPVADALADDRLQGVRVLQFLKALPGVGDTGAARMLADAKVAENRRIKGLGDRQREALFGAYTAA